MKYEVEVVRTQRPEGSVCSCLGMLAIDRMAKLGASRLSEAESRSAVITVEALAIGDSSLPPAGMNMHIQLLSYGEEDFELLGGATSERTRPGIAYT